MGQLMIHAFNGYKVDPVITDKFAAGTKVTDAKSFTPNYRSNYMFLMGSVVFVTGISSNSITTNTNADNLLIPIYCPINDSTNNTIVQRSGIPTLYMAFMKMTSFNSVASVNRIYSTKMNNANTNFQYATIITNETIGNLYYKDAFTNPELFLNSSPNKFYDYLFTLRWAPYTSTITNANNTLYFYYGNNSGTFTTDPNPNCTGHTLLLNSSLVTLNSVTTNIKKAGFLNVTNPAVYDGSSSKFYYLGNEFNKAIMMGLGLATNPVTGADYTIGKFSAQALTSETSTYYLTGVNRPAVDKFYVNNVFNPQFFALGYFCASAQMKTMQIWSNYITNPSSLTKSFILDFNPPITSPKTWTVTVTQDKSETIFKNDVAGNAKMTIALPAKIPGGINI